MKLHSYSVRYTDPETRNTRRFNMYAANHAECVKAAVRSRGADPTTVTTKRREPLYLKGNAPTPDPWVPESEWV